jgi:hypothetical protein
MFLIPLNQEQGRILFESFRKGTGNEKKLLVRAIDSGIIRPL